MSTPVRRALLSVSDKTDLLEFARGLHALGVEIVSTGGTARALSQAGIPLVSIEDFTGFPEILGGRLKTLHPRVHGGILYRRDEAGDRDTMESQGFLPIDLVAVNLYPFERTVQGGARAEVVEQIDIGGPSMIRSAAKNHAAVTVVVSPDQYAQVLEEMRRHGGGTTFEFRRRLARTAFERTAAYDAAIAAYFAGEGAPAESQPLPEVWSRSWPRTRVLRYGENPHQQAALYGGLLDHFRQLGGRDLSYNNLLDLMAAQEMAEVLGRRGPAVAIIKHSNPCGAAVGTSLAEAWRHALATDPAAASGGIISSSVVVDSVTAAAMKDHFIEVLVAPGYTDEALELLGGKKNRILLECPRPLFTAGATQFRSVPGGVLVQTPDHSRLDEKALRVVSRRQPSAAEMEALSWAWDVVRFIKSNAIVFARRDRTLAIGAGQMSRVDAVRLAVLKAAAAEIDLDGSVLASDAFFPFPDGLVTAAEAGARAVIQPGGSVRDKDVIAAADARDIAMVFTGVRHFRH